MAVLTSLTSFDKAETPLIPTGLFKELSVLFGSVLRDMGLLQDVRDQSSALWDGSSFQPMADLLTKLALSGDWTPDHFAKFLAVVADRPLSDPSDKTIAALEEAFKTDPMLRAFGEIGLSPKFFYGGGLGDADLYKLADAFMAALLSPFGGEEPVNQAPTIDPNAPQALSLVEGESLGLSLAKLFTDPDGDRLDFRVEGGGARLAWTLDAEGNLILAPGLAAAGVHELVLHAGDGEFAVSHRISVTIADAGAGTRLSTSDFSRILGQAETFDDALAQVARSRGIDILDQSAVGPGTHTVLSDNLFLNAQSTITASLALGTAARVLTVTGDAHIALTGNALDNVVTFSRGHDSIRAGAGNDQVYGGGGNDSFDGESGNDKLFGDVGDDRLTGGDGDDQLFGGDGADVLRGGAGRDQATGGAGADLFEFVRGDGTFTILDARPGEDTIQLSGFAGITDAASLLAQATVQEFAGFTRVSIGGEVLNIHGVTAAHLTDALFDFV